MRKKSIFISLAILIVLALVMIITEFFGKEKTVAGSLVFPELNIDDVASVKIKTKDQKVELSKDGEIWVVATIEEAKEDGNWVVVMDESYPADPLEMEEMRSKFMELKIERVASKSSGEYPEFEVDEQNAVEITMLGADGSIMAHFFVGARGTHSDSNYLRKADEDRVLQVGEYLGIVFPKNMKDMKEWRDKSVFNIFPDNASDMVKKMTLVYEEEGKKEESIIEAGEDGNWHITNQNVEHAARLLEKDAVNDIIKKMAGMKLSKFAEKKPGKSKDELLKEYKLDEPKSSITLDLKDGTTRVLLIGDESEGKYYIKRKEKDAIFLIYKGAIDSIFRDLDNLKVEVKEEDKTK